MSEKSDMVADGEYLAIMINVHERVDMHREGLTDPWHCPHLPMQMWY